MQWNRCLERTKILDESEPNFNVPIIVEDFLANHQDNFLEELPKMQRDKNIKGPFILPYGTTIILTKHCPLLVLISFRATSTTTFLVVVLPDLPIDACSLLGFFLSWYSCVLT